MSRFGFFLVGLVSLQALGETPLSDKTYYNHPKANVSTNCNTIISKLGEPIQRNEKDETVEHIFNSQTGKAKLTCQRISNTMLELVFDKTSGSILGLPTIDLGLSGLALQEKYSNVTQHRIMSNLGKYKELTVIDGSNMDVIFVSEKYSLDNSFTHSITLRYGRKMEKEARKEIGSNLYMIWKNSSFQSQSKNQKRLFSNWGCKNSFFYEDEEGNQNELRINFSNLLHDRESFKLSSNGKDVEVSGIQDSFSHYVNGDSTALSTLNDKGTISLDSSVSAEIFINLAEKMRRHCITLK